MLLQTQCTFSVRSAHKQFIKYQMKNILQRFNIQLTDAVFSYSKPYDMFTPCSSVSFVNFEQVNAGWPLVK